MKNFTAVRAFLIMSGPPTFVVAYGRVCPASSRVVLFAGIMPLVASESGAWLVAAQIGERLHHAALLLQGLRLDVDLRMRQLLDGRRVTLAGGRHFLMRGGGRRQRILPGDRLRQRPAVVGGL